MSKISLELIQQLRERTGVGMMDCKKALEETNGDVDKAVELLRKKGAAISEKRGGNATSEGIIQAYIHPGSQVGVLVEINCETDFVARTDDVKQFAHDVCMHIAAFKPHYVAPADVTADIIEQEKRIYTEQLAATKKPANILEQIIAGKLDKFYAEVCLIKQPFIKNDQISVEDRLKELMAKMGENIKIRRFVRYEVGA